jgi:hypothetical protein
MERVVSSRLNCKCRKCWFYRSPQRKTPIFPKKLIHCCSLHCHSVYAMSHDPSSLSSIVRCLEPRSSRQNSFNRRSDHNNGYRPLLHWSAVFSSTCYTFKYEQIEHNGAATTLGRKRGKVVRARGNIRCARERKKSSKFKFKRKFRYPDDGRGESGLEYKCTPCSVSAFLEVYRISLALMFIYCRYNDIFAELS